MQKCLLVFCLFLITACASSNEELSKRFQNNNDDTVLDIETGLMWAASANDQSVTWFEAKEYCETYTGGGYHDWRMPKQSELMGLLKAGLRKNEETIRIGGDLVWAEETDDSKGVICSFRNDGCAWMEQVISIALRALPVRDTGGAEILSDSRPVKPSKSMEERLLMLESFYKQNLISKEEYQSKKADILNEL